MRMRSERKSVSYERTSVLPVFPASRPAACRSSSDRPGRHGYAPTLNGAVPRSFVSTMCMRAMDIDSRHSADDVNRLSANFEHPVALVTRRTRAQRRSLSFQLPMWACRWPDAAAKSVQHAHDEELLLPPVTPGDKTRRTDLREQRRRRQHGCWDQLIVAPLWVAYEANLGTLLRRCDAVGACMAVPSTDHYLRALDRGDTLPRRSATSTGCGGRS
jgi:hypothetical protein